MLKQNKGITLVALVITIIVLLILAGVSISLVVGDNGVLTQATNASSKTDEASAKQSLEMALASVQGDYINDWTNDITTDLFRSKLSTKTEVEKVVGTDGFTIDTWTYTQPEGTGASATGGKVIGVMKTTKTGNEYSFEINQSGQMGAVLKDFKKTK